LLPRAGNESVAEACGVVLVVAEFVRAESVFAEDADDEQERGESTLIVRASDGPSNALAEPAAPVRNS
jgi:hypothetical protein